MKFWCLFLLLFLFTIGINSQVSRILVREEISLSGNLTNTMYGEVKLYMPVSGPNQLVLGRRFNLEPNQILDKGEKSMAIWNVADVRTSRKITIETSLLVQNNSTIKSSLFDNEMRDDPDKYLREEKGFPYKEREIQEMVKQLKHTHRDSLIQEIIQKVRETFVYRKSPWHGVKLIKAIHEGKGDCTEYAALMVTLCRAKGIPARLVIGLLLQPYGEHHNWAEVFTMDKGWVRWDPLDYAFDNFLYRPNKAYVSTGYDLQPRYNVEVANGIEWNYEAKLMSNSQTLSDIAHLFFKSQNYKKADSLYSILITELPQHFLNYNLLALSKARQNKFNEALPLLQQAMRLSRNEGEKCLTYYAFARLAALKNDAAMAVKYLKKVLENGCMTLKSMANEPDFGLISQDEKFNGWLYEQLEK
ncbi:MAG: lasso peptide biosynthesis protein [Saprospiraceae bacterium]|nr:lasso peptide biosynthesis protein [Saprospiraceae bacterium]